MALSVTHSILTRCLANTPPLLTSHDASRRTRYNQYNSDVDTKAMRASAALIPVWDDHEYAK